MPAEQAVTAARPAPATPAGEIARVTQTEARVVHNGCGTRRPWWRLPEGSCSRGGSSTAADGYTGDNVGDIVCSPRQVAAERTPIDAITGVRSNQDLIWYVKIGLYMDFNVYGGS